MSNRRLSSPGATYLRRGDWNAWCQRCGGKFKASQLIKEWDELLVCHTCFEDRHPQDMVRGVPDFQAVPWASPELPDNFVINAAITGLTQAPFAPGPEFIFDNQNVLTVMVSGGTLSSAADRLAVENGANLCAVMNAGSPGQPDTDQQTGRGDEVLHPLAPAWEILQFTTATLTAPATYQLSGLLRARYGTEAAMNLGTLAAGSPFVFIGQASPSNDEWIKGNLGWGFLPISPVYIGGFNSNGDQWFTWIRRSRHPGLWDDDFDGQNGINWIAPMDEPDERYQVDVLNASGGVVRSLYAIGAQTVVYPLGWQIQDWGAVQASYRITVYQLSPILGRGQGRTATIIVQSGTANAVLGDGLSDVLADTNGNVLLG